MAEEIKQLEKKEEQKTETKEEHVLILHGWEDDSTKGIIPELVKTLKDKGYSTIAPDLPNTKTPKFEEWYHIAEKEIKKLKDKTISIVGHSMGGLLALKLAEKYKLNKLILIAPVGSKPSDEFFNSPANSDLNKEELEIFRKYQDREIDAEKIKSNSKDIRFIFGKKDIWINEEIRNFYSKKFENTAKFDILEDKGHMGEDEGLKKLPIVEELFENKQQKQEPSPKKEEQKPETKIEKPETKTETKKETPKKETPSKKPEKPKPKKEEVIARGLNLRVSKKQSMYICSFIKNKHIDTAIAHLELVTRQKMVVPFKGEIPHRKGKNIMSGRYPQKAADLFIKLLKGLRGNILINNMDLEKTRIYIASASWASRPMRSNNRQAKRTNVILKAREIKIP